MSDNKKVSRRKFLVRGGIGTLGVLALGTYVFRNSIRRGIYEVSETIVPPYAGSGTKANLWFEITKDNRVILHSPKVEMGQGIFTGLAQIAADELDVDIKQIQVVAAATATGVVDSLSTGGSISVASLWQPLREMGATLREMVKREAAIKMGVEAVSLSTESGMVIGKGKSISYAEAVEGITEWKLPNTPELRPIQQYNFIGKSIKRLDLDAKVLGHPIFGMDAEMPGMLHACIIRPAHIGATLKSVEANQAKKMPGVVEIVEMDNSVGIVAASFPQALAAKNEVKVEWNVSKKWTEAAVKDLLQVGKGDKMITQKLGKASDAKAVGLVSMEFRTPPGAHAQIEPNGAVAEVKDGKVTIIMSTQVIGLTQKQVAKALDLPEENVNIIPTYLGGGFGRRLDTRHAIEAAQLSQAVGKPVKYFFTRKEEFQHDAFRPPTHHIMRGKLNDNGLMEELEHHYASGDVTINAPLFPAVINKALGTDVGAMRGGNIHYDKVPNHRAVQWHTTLPFATSAWRSLGLLANTFAIESFVDEMAIKAGKDPVEFRLAHISNEGNSKRLKDVIQKAGEFYKDGVNNGRAMGIAASIDTGSPCAQVVEVSIENNEIKVHKVTCVFDCGIAVNPDQVKAQCEGSIIMGMSAALYEKMTIKDGQLFPTIYGPYQMAMMKHAPKEIEVILLEGADQPLPVGEPPLGPIGAAVGNALRRLTNKRLTELPMRLL